MPERILSMLLALSPRLLPVVPDVIHAAGLAAFRLPYVRSDVDPRQRHGAHSWRALLSRQFRFFLPMLCKLSAQKSLPPRKQAAHAHRQHHRVHNVVRLRADVMCSLCQSVAMRLSTLEFRQSINASIQCASLCLRILMNLLSVDSESKDATRQHRRALFVAAHETRCYPVQVVTTLADRQAAICLIDKLRFAF
jgi:hypothetical protein